MESTEKNTNKTASALSKIKEKILNKKEVDFTAEYAWMETTYGIGAYKTTAELGKAI